MPAKLITALAFILDDKGKIIRVLKHRNILNNDKAKDSYYAFMKRDHNDVSYVNWYEKSSHIGKRKIQGKFIERIYLK